MKYFITLFVLLTFLVAGETTTNLKVKGMACQYSCVNKVKSVLNDVDGIESCNVNFETSTATVSFDDAKITPAEIKKILSKKTDFDISLENEPEKKESSIKSFFRKIFNS
jgi:copper chaperone CopZ